MWNRYSKQDFNLGLDAETQGQLCLIVCKIFYMFFINCHFYLNLTCKMTIENHINPYSTQN